MTSIPVTVRHAGKKFDLELDLNEPGLTFKSQLYSLTGVLPDRQKILVKGGQLKDDQDMTELNIKPNHVFMLLGTAGELPKAPTVVPQFVEDMTEKQLAKASKEPCGLINVGNTCYMNSTLQALGCVPELRERLNDYNGSDRNDIYGRITRNLRDQYRTMATSGTSFSPHLLLSSFRDLYPQFAERDETGMYRQQDAEEAWSQLLLTLRTTLKDEDDVFVDKYFGGNYKTTMKCIEDDKEPIVDGNEQFWKVNCHITVNTNFLNDGLIAGLEEEITKFNKNLNRDAKYKLTRRIDRLPKYLTVHFMRFFWRTDTRKKSKILRKVVFPMVYDATELCTEELQKKLLPAREKFREAEKEKQELEGEARKKRNDSNEEKEPAISVEKMTELRKTVTSSIDHDLKNDQGCNPYGIYQLATIITHRGPTAEGGHYQCFIKSNLNKNKWWKFNDDIVTLIDEDKIQTLAGGGESDSALILLYRTVSL